MVVLLSTSATIPATSTATPPAPIPIPVGGTIRLLGSVMLVEAFPLTLTFTVVERSTTPAIAKVAPATVRAAP